MRLSIYILPAHPTFVEVLGVSGVAGAVPQLPRNLSYIPLSIPVPLQDIDS